jgi:hypothetical protein
MDKHKHFYLFSSSPPLREYHILSVVEVTRKMRQHGSNAARGIPVQLMIMRFISYGHSPPVEEEDPQSPYRLTAPWGFAEQAYYVRSEPVPCVLCPVYYCRPLWVVCFNAVHMAKKWMGSLTMVSNETLCSR